MFHFLTDSRARTRRTRRARRPAVSQLEALENRTCLTAFFSTSFPVAGTLQVAEVAGSGSKVTISENAAHNMITVAGSGLGTAINGSTSTSFNLALTPINSINVTYLSANNANDTLTVQDVSLPNSLNVALANKAPTTPAVATLGNNTVNILRDHFLSAVVTSTAASTAHDHVTVDHVTGNVSVTESNGIGDSIRVKNSSIGPATLIQGNGLADKINVDTVTVAGSLAITQTSMVNEGDSASIENVHATSLFNYTGGAGIDYTELENVQSSGGTVDGGAGGNVLDSDGTSSGFSVVNYLGFINQPDSAVE